MFIVFGSLRLLEAPKQTHNCINNYKEEETKRINNSYAKMQELQTH